VSSVAVAVVVVWDGIVVCIPHVGHSPTCVRELVVSCVYSGVHNINRHATASLGRRPRGAVQRQGGLVKPVEAPRHGESGHNSIFSNAAYCLHRNKIQQCLRAYVSQTNKVATLTSPIFFDLVSHLSVPTFPFLIFRGLVNVLH